MYASFFDPKPRRDGGDDAEEYEDEGEEDDYSDEEEAAGAQPGDADWDGGQLFDTGEGRNDDAAGECFSL